MHLCKNWGHLALSMTGFFMSQSSVSPTSLVLVVQKRIANVQILLIYACLDTTGLTYVWLNFAPVKSYSLSLGSY